MDNNELSNQDVMDLDKKASEFEQREDAEEVAEDLLAV